MADTQQIEAVLAPHRESLMCLIDFAVDKSNLALAGKAARASLRTSKSSKESSQVQRALTAVPLLDLGSFEPVKNGKIDYSAFTAETCAGLLGICYLSNNPTTRTRYPELGRKLRAAEFGYHVELARALARFY